MANSNLLSGVRGYRPAKWAVPNADGVWRWLGLWLVLWMALGLSDRAYAVNVWDCSNPYTVCAEAISDAWKYDVHSGAFKTASYDNPDMAIEEGRSYLLPGNCSVDKLSVDAFEENTYRGSDGVSNEICGVLQKPYHYITWIYNLEKIQAVCADYRLTRCNGYIQDTTTILTRSRNVNCPSGFLVHSEPNSFDWCYSYDPSTIRFYLAAPYKPQCGLSKGNPCNPATGEKFQTEEDIRLPLSGLSFTRYYSSQGVGENTAGLGVDWSHSFAQRMDRFYTTQTTPVGVGTSTFYSSRVDACTKGWDEIKNTAFSGAFKNASAAYNAGLCTVTDGNTTLTLEIHSTEGAVYSAESSGYANPDDEWHVVERPNGARYLFRNQGGRWTPDASGIGVVWTDGTWIEQNHQPVQLARPDANTWRFTDEDGTVEEYDRDGYVRTATDRAGRVTSYAYVAGKLDHITDAFGQSLQFTYDPATGLLQSVAGPGGTVGYQYDSSDPNHPKLSAVVYPDNTPADLTNNPTRTFFYEKPALPFHLTGIKDESGTRYATWDYDAQGRAILSTHAGNADKTSFAYNADGTTTLTNPLGGTQTYQFTVAGDGVRLAGIVDPVVNGQPVPNRCPACQDGPGHDFKYDAHGNITSRADFNGNTTCYAYDPNRDLETTRVEGLAPGKACPSNLAGYTPASGTVERKILTEWHATWRLPTRVSEPKRRTVYTYGDSPATCGATGTLCKKTEQATTDASGNLGFSAALSGNPRTWTYTYNGLGQLLTANGPRNDTGDALDKTTYAYYAANDASANRRFQLQTVTDVLGHVTTYNDYGAYGRPTQITDPNGLATQLYYDARGRLYKLVRGGLTTQVTYYPTGLPKTIATPDQGTITYGYDGAHRLTSITNGAGEKLAYTLDAAGNPTQERTLAAGSTTASTALNRKFDTLGRLWKVLNAANQEVQVFAYDAQGNPVSQTDKPDATPDHDQTTAFTLYDALDRLRQLTDPLNGPAKFGYDGLDQLLSVTDARSHVTGYSVTGLGLQTQENSPDRGVVNNTVFDPAGNLKTTVDAQGNTTQYQYDALGRPLLATFTAAAGVDPSGDIAYEYDSGANAVGRLDLITDATGSTGYQYDTLGRLAVKTQTTGALSRVVSYGYNPATGRLDTLTYPSGTVVGYTYDAAGRVNSLTVTTNAQAQTTLLSNIQYRPQGPLASYTLAAVTGAPVIARSYDADGRVTGYTLADATKQLTLDRLGNVAVLGDVGNPANDQVYTYDKLNRLTDFTAPGLVRHYGYDATGNRTVKALNGASTAYVPDPASNRLASAGGVGYVYDASGNLLDRDTSLERFAYDARGRLVRATTTTGAVYAYGINGLGQRVSKTGPGIGRVFVYDEAGHLLGEYDAASGARQAEHIYLGDLPVATVGSGGVVYPVLTDHLGTPRQIIDSARRLRWRWDASDPFGNNAANQNPAGLGGFGYNPRFPGQYYDAETGLNYNYFRDYDPAAGRYVESDPIGLLGGVNTYGYVGGNPINQIDPLGLHDLGPAIGGALGNILDWLNPPPAPIAPEPYKNSDCNPSKKDCSTAIKLLEQVDRLAQKLGKKLPKKRLDDLRSKINDGTITSADLPADIQNEFPSELRYRSLSEIRQICGKSR